MIACETSPFSQAVPALRRYLAYVDSEAVGAADAIFLPAGVVMCGGARSLTREGRGVYQALVAARWEEGRRRGTPVLVTQAGSMSRPILGRLGFQELVEVRIFVDDFGA